MTKKARHDIYFGTERLERLVGLAHATGHTVTDLVCTAVDTFVHDHAEMRRQISTQVAILITLLCQSASSAEQIGVVIHDLGVLLDDPTHAEAIADGIRQWFHQTLEPTD